MRKTPCRHVRSRSHDRQDHAGEIETVTIDDGKNAAVSLDWMGGKARTVGMSVRKRKEIAKKVVANR